MYTFVSLISLKKNFTPFGARLRWMKAGAHAGLAELILGWLDSPHAGGDSSG